MSLSFRLTMSMTNRRHDTTKTTLTRQFQLDDKHKMQSKTEILRRMREKKLLNSIEGNWSFLLGFENSTRTACIRIHVIPNIAMMTSNTIMAVVAHEKMTNTSVTCYQYCQFDYCRSVVVTLLSNRRRVKQVTEMILCWAGFTENWVEMLYKNKLNLIIWKSSHVSALSIVAYTLIGYKLMLFEAELPFFSPHISWRQSKELNWLTDR